MRGVGGRQRERERGGRETEIEIERESELCQMRFSCVIFGPVT